MFKYLWVVLAQALLNGFEEDHETRDARSNDLPPFLVLHEKDQNVKRIYLIKRPAFLVHN